MKRKAIALCLCLLASCTTVGPFITSIASDGNGNLIIEMKAVSQYTMYSGNVEGNTLVYKLDLSKAGPAVLIDTKKKTKSKQSQIGFDR